MEFARSNALGVVIDPLPGHEHLNGRLSIPYLTDAGPVNMTFRCLKDHNCKEVPDHSKYTFKRNSGTNLYGAQTAAWADEWILVVEGEIDALTWHQIGVPAFGISGATKWQDHWVNVFEDFSRVYVVREGDAAGEKFWDKVSSRVDHSIMVKLPDGEDSNSMYAKHGRDALLSRIKK